MFRFSVNAENQLMLTFRYTKLINFYYLSLKNKSKMWRKFYYFFSNDWIIRVIENFLIHEIYLWFFIFNSSIF